MATEQGPQEAILRELSRHEPRNQQAISMELSSDGGLKGVKPPEAFAERPRDWSLGHAGDEGPHLSMTGWQAAVHGVAEGWTRLSDFTFTFTFMHWRRNGNPLQCSCLENPRDGGAWWAAIYRVTQSQTRLK